MNGHSRPDPAFSVESFNIDQGFTATVTNDLKHYSVMLKCGAWTYGPAIAEVQLAAQRLGGKTAQETKKLLSYAIKQQALKELSRAVMSGGVYDQNRPRPDQNDG